MLIKVSDEKAFGKLVTLAFSQRRKTLRNVLKEVCSAQQLESLGIDPSSRAQTLSLQQFADIFNSLTVSP